MKRFEENIAEGLNEEQAARKVINKQDFPREMVDALTYSGFPACQWCAVRVARPTTHV